MALQFADFTWPSRWNKADAVVILSQSGPDITATAFFGVLRYSMADAESVAAIVNHARRFADAVEQAKQEFDGVCDRCSKSPAPRWSSEICSTCGPVRLCQGCLDLHKTEVAADQVDDALS